MGNTGSKQNTTSRVKANEWIFHPIKYVKALDNYQMKVMFCTGTEKLVDMKELIKNDKHFKELENEKLFCQAHLECDVDYAVTWNENIDISSEALWDMGETTSTAFTELISMKEATDKFGLNQSTIRKAIQAGRFKIGEDIFKFGKQWVLVSAAVDREYKKGG